MSLNKIFGTIFLFLLVIPMSYAFNCDYFEGIDKDNCFEILNSDISQEEKDSLFANVLYGSRTQNDFDVVREWNLAQEIVKSNEAKTASGQFVKNVWFDQFAVMPSILEEDVLYCPEKVEVLTGFDYDLVIPPNYYSGGYPKTSQGDCRREYSLKKNTAQVELLVNGKKQDTGTLATAKISKDSVIESKLSIDVSVDIDHYEWYRYCCARNEDGCTKYCHKCRYEDDETRTDKIRLTDFTEVKLDKTIPSIELELNDEYYGTTKGQVSAKNYSSFELDFEDSSLKRTAYLYEVFFSGEPNYIAALKAIPHKSQALSNLYMENNTFYVSSTEDCSLTSRTHFGIFTDKCNFIINIQNITNEFQFQEFNGDVYFAFGLCIFLFVNYVIYRVIIHYWGRLG